MTPSRDLYDLVHSLAGAEKRYVRRTALLSGRETSWLRLFDAIDAQKEFDEEDLRRRLSGDAMLGNLSVAKRYAYYAVLRALRAYGTGRDFDSEMGEMIEEYKVLAHKGLHDQAARLMREIKRKALAGDAYMRYLWTVIAEFGTGVHSTENAAMDHLEATIDEQQWVLSRIANYSFFGNIYFRQRIILRHRPTARSAEEMEQLRRIVAPLIEMREEDLLTRTSWGFHHLTLGDYWEAVGQPEQARAHYDRFLEPEHLELEIGATDSLHLAEFTAALFFRLRHRMTDGLEPSIEALGNRVGKLDRRRRAFTTQIWFYERWIVTSLMLRSVTGRIEEAVELLRREGERIDELMPMMSKKMRLQLLHTIAGVRLAQGDHGAAIEALNMVLNDGEASTDEYGVAMLLALVAHVEAGNTDWLDAAIRSTTRHLTSHQRYHETEKAMIAGLRSVLRAHDEKGRRAAYLRLHEKLRKLFTDPRERTVSSAIDLLAWSKAHAEGKGFGRNAV